MSNEQQSRLLNDTLGWQSPPSPCEGVGSASPSSASNGSSVNRSINTISQADLETLDKNFPSTPRTDTLEHFKADLQALDDGSSPTPLLSFRVPPQREEILASFLRQLGAARYSYDFETGDALVEMGETTMHAQCSVLLTRLLQRCIDSVRATLAADVAVNDPLAGPAIADQVATRRVIARLGSLWQNDSARIFKIGTFTKQPDAQFREEVDDDAPGDVAKFPPILAEVAFSQLATDVERKARLYIDQTNGLIRTVIVLDIASLDARKATFSLWVADPSGKPVLAQEAVIYDAAADVQPDGQVHLFAADFLSEALETLPAHLKRPSPVENASQQHTLARLHATITFEELRALVKTAYKRHCVAEN